MQKARKRENSCGGQRSVQERDRWKGDGWSGCHLLRRRTRFGANTREKHGISFRIFCTEGQLSVQESKRNATDRCQGTVLLQMTIFGARKREKRDRSLPISSTYCAEGHFGARKPENYRNSSMSMACQVPGMTYQVQYWYDMYDSSLSTTAQRDKFGCKKSGIESGRSLAITSQKDKFWCKKAREKVTDRCQLVRRRTHFGARKREKRGRSLAITAHKDKIRCRNERETWQIFVNNCA